jgi:hypothetical protein
VTLVGIERGVQEKGREREIEGVRNKGEEKD